MFQVVCAQLSRMAMMTITALLLARLQLPSEQILLLCQRILSQALVSPATASTGSADMTVGHIVQQHMHVHVDKTQMVVLTTI